MTDIVFAFTEYFYQSYTDMTRLAEISGFETCYVKDLDIRRDAVFITTPINGEIRPHLTYRRSIHEQKCRIIWWALERGRIEPEILNYVDDIWFSDRAYKETSGLRSQFVPLGSDEALVSEPRGPGGKFFDVAHLSYIFGRRENAINTLYRYKIAEQELGKNGLWGAERHKALEESRFLLNLHQDDFLIIEPLRFALAAAYGIPVLSEKCNDPYPYVPGEDFVEIPDIWSVEETLARVMAEDYAKYRAMGQRMKKKMCETYRFKDVVRQVVESIL